MDWKTKHQVFERNWHGNCANSYWEETKQRVYARKMGLEEKMVDGKFPVFNLNGASILDIGSGPYSLLLKCINFRKAYAVDPCRYPQWTKDRYASHDVVFVQKKGEDLQNHPEVDEVWIYNCLQHVENPSKIIENAWLCSKIIRLFEWIDNGVSIGHPQNLTEKDLNKWLGGIGKVENLDESGCHGRAYFGIFKGLKYD